MPQQSTRIREKSKTVQGNSAFTPAMVMNQNGSIAVRLVLHYLATIPG
jgi:hypothetical protein